MNVDPARDAGVTDSPSFGGLLLRSREIAVGVLLSEGILGLADLVGAQVEVVIGEHGAKVLRCRD